MFIHIYMYILIYSQEKERMYNAKPSLYKLINNHRHHCLYTTHQWGKNNQELLEKSGNPMDDGTQSTQKSTHVTSISDYFIVN